MTTTGRFVWHELHTSDRSKALKFYAQALGVGDERGPDGPGGDLRSRPAGRERLRGNHEVDRPPASRHTGCRYIAVDDVDKAAAKIKELGGKVLSPPMDIPEVGRFAAVADPQGAAFAIYKGNKPDPEEPKAPPVGAFCWKSS